MGSGPELPAGRGRNRTARGAVVFTVGLAGQKRRRSPVNSGTKTAPAREDTMTRFLIAVLTLVTFAVSANAQDLKKIRITQAVASFAFLPIDYAKAAGYFAEEGLEVEQIATRGGGPDLTALISGDVEFNAAAGTYQIGAIKAGRDVINVYNFYSRNTAISNNGEHCADPEGNADFCDEGVNNVSGGGNYLPDPR